MFDFVEGNFIKWSVIVVKSRFCGICFLWLNFLLLNCFFWVILFMVCKWLC